MPKAKTAAPETPITPTTQDPPPPIDPPAPPAEPVAQADTPPPEPEPTPELADELRAAESDTVNQLLGLGDEPPAATDEPPPPPPAKPAAAAAPEKKLKVIAPAPPPAAMTADDIAKVAAQTVAEFRKTETKPAAPPVVIAEIPETVKKYAPDYAQLERLFPDKYKPGLTNRMAEFVAKEVQYADEWESKNAGQTYNADDDEHAEFYETNQPKIDPADLEEAKFERRYQERIARDVAPKLEAINEREAVIKAEPILKEASDTVREQLFHAFNEEHEGPVTQEQIKAWEEADPFLAQITKDVHAAYEKVAQETSLIYDNIKKLKVSGDSEEAKLHQAVRSLFVDMERELAAEPPERRVNANGVPWVPLATYNAMSAADRAKVCTTDRTSLNRYAGILAGRKAKEIAANVEASVKTMPEFWMKKFGYVKAPAGNGAPAPPAKPAPKPAAPRSPSIGGGSPTGPSAGTVPAQNDSTATLVDRLLGLPQGAA